MESQVNITINHLQHVGIPVTNIANSVLFYQRLGFSCAMQSAFTISSGKGECIMMRNNAVLLELYQLPKAELEGVRVRGNGHIDHIAFDVSDIETVFEQLKADSFTILEEAPVYLSFWTRGCRYFNITGPDGERLEFNQVL